MNRYKMLAIVIFANQSRAMVDFLFCFVLLLYIFKNFLEVNCQTFVIKIIHFFKKGITYR